MSAFTWISLSNKEPPDLHLLVTSSSQSDLLSLSKHPNTAHTGLGVDPHGLMVTHLIRDRWERSLVSQAVNLRAGVVVAMGGQMLKSGARVQSLEVALGMQVRLCRHHTI